MKYRRLKLDEKPDYRKGDEYHVKGREWSLTNCYGTFTIQEWINDDPTVKYRRPVDVQGRDLK